MRRPELCVFVANPQNTRMQQISKAARQLRLNCVCLLPTRHTTGPVGPPRPPAGADADDGEADVGPPRPPPGVYCADTRLLLGLLWPAILLARHMLTRGGCIRMVSAARGMWTCQHGLMCVSVWPCLSVIAAVQDVLLHCWPALLLVLLLLYTLLKSGLSAPMCCSCVQAVMMMTTWMKMSQTCYLMTHTTCPSTTKSHCRSAHLLTSALYHKHEHETTALLGVSPADSISSSGVLYCQLCCADSLLTVWCCADSVRLQGQGRAVTCLDIDPSGSRLITGSLDYTVRMFDFSGMKSDLRSFR